MKALKSLGGGSILVKPLFFVTFNIIIRQIFPKNLTEIPLFIQKIWRFCLLILAIFIDYHQFFGLLDIYVLKRN